MCCERASPTQNRKQNLAAGADVLGEKAREPLGQGSCRGNEGKKETALLRRVLVFVGIQEPSAYQQRPERCKGSELREIDGEPPTLRRGMLSRAEK